MIAIDDMVLADAANVALRAEVALALAVEVLGEDHCETEVQS